jgi:hypothetical protein
LTTPIGTLPAPPVPVRPPLVPPDAPDDLGAASGPASASDGGYAVALGARISASGCCGFGGGLSRCDARVRLGSRCRLGGAQLDLFELGGDRCLLLGQSLTHGFIGEALLLDLAEALHLGFGIGLQPGEQLLLVLDRLLLTSEFVASALEFLLRCLELVERTTPGIGDDIDEDIGLDLVLRCLHTGQQRNALGAAAGEPGDRHRLDVAAELVDPLLDGVGSAFHTDRCVLEHFEIRLGLEVGVCGSVGSIAGSLDLPGRLAGSVVAGLRDGIGRNDGADRHDRGEGGQQRSHGASETSENGTGGDAPMARTGVDRDGDGRDGSWHCRWVTGKVRRP